MDYLRLASFEDTFECATEMASIMKVDVMYAMKHVMNNKVTLIIGPSRTKPYG